MTSKARTRVALIGAGAMGQALSQGAHKTAPGQWDFIFFDTNPHVAKRAADAVLGQTAPSMRDALSQADLVVLAVKAQILPEVLKELGRLDVPLISIAAGRSTEEITETLMRAGADDPRVVRAMPNVNARVGKATTAICGNQFATQADLGTATALLESVGDVMEIPETMFGAFTAVAGSSPAWFFRIVNSLAAAGVNAGLSKTDALRATALTMAGSAAMLVETLDNGGHPEELVDLVCSPGGTTIAGLLAAEAAGLSPSLADAVEAAIERDKELGK